MKDREMSSGIDRRKDRGIVGGMDIRMVGVKSKEIIGEEWLEGWRMGWLLAREVKKMNRELVGGMHR